MSAHEWLHILDYVGCTTTIGPAALDDDVLWEVGTQALVLEITAHDSEMWSATLDFRPFMATNTALMRPTFYDKAGVARLTIMEAGLWRPVDIYYLPPPSFGWEGRLHKGPRWRATRGGVRTGPNHATKASVFADDTALHAWKRQPLPSLLQDSAIPHLA